MQILKRILSLRWCRVWDLDHVSLIAVSTRGFPLREKCPNREFFLTRIFLYSVRIQENTDQKKLRIWALFTQCWTAKLFLAIQIPNPLDTIISEIKKEIIERIKTELKLFKVESAKHLSESLTWYKEQTNVLKEECKSKDINLGKLSKTFENLTSKKTLLKLRDIQTNLNLPATEPLHRDIMP